MRRTATTIVFATSFVLLNIYLAWAGRLLSAVSPTLFSIVYAPIFWSDMTVWSALHLSKVSPFAFIVTDFEVLALFLIMVVSAFRLSRSRGLGAAVLRSTQVSAVSLVVFEAELAFLDCKEFFIHMTDFQTSFNIIPWFTNADMLLCAFAVLSVSTLLLRRLRLGSADSARMTIEHSGKPTRMPPRFLILFLFGILLLVGGSILAYYGGVWRFSYSSASGMAGDNGVLGAASSSSHSILTSYTYCESQLKLLSNLANNSSCGLESLNLGELVFASLGGLSILLGVFAVLKPPRPLAEGVDKLQSLLARFIPSLGRATAYVSAWEKESESNTAMVLLGIEVLLGVALFVSGAGLLGFLSIPSSCAVPPSPYGF